MQIHGPQHLRHHAVNTTPAAGKTIVQAGLYGTAKVSENMFAHAGISDEAHSGQRLGAINLGLKVQF